MIFQFRLTHNGVTNFTSIKGSCLSEAKQKLKKYDVFKKKLSVNEYNKHSFINALDSLSLEDTHVTIEQMTLSYSVVLN